VTELREPSGNDIEAEFGVRISYVDGPCPWWWCPAPGSDLFIHGETLGDLRDQLIKHRRAAAAILGE
jgi:hypothetical protein